MQEHPKSEGKFKYIGIPQVGPGYIKAHIEGAQATTLFIPTNNKGICNHRPLQDAILHAAAALLSVPQQYSRILGQLGLQIAEVWRMQQYDAARFGHENRLGLVQIAHYLASIGFTKDEAEQLHPWAAAFLEMDLEEHPHSCLAEELQTAKVHMHEVIDSVAVALANCRLEPELELAPIRAKLGCIWSSHHFSWLPLSQLTAC